MKFRSQVRSECQKLSEGQRLTSEAELTAGVSCHLPHLKLGAAAIVGDDAPVEVPPTKSVWWCWVRRALLPAASAVDIISLPGSWNVGQAADWGLTEASVENSEVAPCTKSLKMSGEHSWSCDSAALLCQHS